MDEPPEFHQNIADYLRNITPPINQSIWIGLTDRTGTNTLSSYEWSAPPNQQLNIDYAHWGVGQPDSSTSLCVVMQFTSTKEMLYWDDRNCDTNYRYLCQKGNL